MEKQGGYTYMCKACGRHADLLVNDRCMACKEQQEPEKKENFNCPKCDYLGPCSYRYVNNVIVDGEHRDRQKIKVCPQCGYANYYDLF